MQSKEEIIIMIFVKFEISVLLEYVLPLIDIFISSFFNYMIPESSSFVFGLACFAEKLACGTAFLVIQNNAPVKLDPCEINCDYFQYVLVAGCGFSSILGISIISVLYPMEIRQR